MSLDKTASLEKKTVAKLNAKLTPRHLLTRRSGIALAAVTTLSVALIATTWAVLNGSSDSQTASNPSQATQTNDAGEIVRYLKVEAQPLRRAGPDFLVQKFTGVVTARRTSRLAAKAVGRVESINVDLGDRVRAGDILLTLDEAQLRAEYSAAKAGLSAAVAMLDEMTRGPRRQDIEQAEFLVSELEANLELSRANLSRLTSLKRSRVISEQEYDEGRYDFDALQAKLDSSRRNLDQLLEGTRAEQIAAQRAVVSGLEAQIERIEADLRDRSIIAPFDGSVLQRNFDEGAVVSPGQALLTLVEAPPYEVRVGLPEDLASTLTDSNFFVTASGETLSAKIDRMAPAINESTRTREVVLLLSEASSQASSIGGAVSVTVQRPLERRRDSDSYWVPNSALTAGARGLWAVFVAKPQTAEDGGQQSDYGTHAMGDTGEQLSVIERRQVELLRAQGDWSEIQGPLDADELLVVSGVHRVAPGQTVVSVPQVSANETK